MFDMFVDDYCMFVGMCCQVCCLQFGLYFVVFQGVGIVVGYCIELWIIGMCFVDQLGIGIVVWIGVEYIVVIGKDYQQVGFDQVGYQCCQGVVVVEVDFVGDYCVVFVDYWDYVQFDQGLQGVVGVQVVFVVGEVVMGQ